MCSVSLLEAAILHRLGRWQMRAPLAEFFAVALAANFRQLLELTPGIAVKTNELPAGFQGDPFDRAIAATAALLNLTLITTDPAIGMPKCARWSITRSGYRAHRGIKAAASPKMS